jgi:CRISPR-associated protein Cas1
MDAVYVLEPGAYLRLEGESLKVVKGNKVIEQIPAAGLKRLMLIGYMSLSGAVLDFLIRKRVETVFMSPTGRFRARLALDEHRHVALRKAQYIHLSNQEFALATAKIVVRGKMENMTRLLLLRARELGDKTLKEEAAKLRAIAAYIETAGNLEAVRGLEGLGSQAYFQAFRRLIRNDSFTFSGRNRRPPLDPVNALLSFVYTMLTNEVLSAVKASGLDPYLGALHEVSYGRPSLACDLVEEYRAFLGDRLVLGLVNRKVVRPDDFVYRKKAPSNFVDEDEMKTKRPVEMKPAVNRAFISAYEEMMNRKATYRPLKKKITYRWLILNQVRGFSRYLEDPDKVYLPFLWER